ncbi:MAG TPA: HAD-IA family hydrolase [Armatimonadota bacterium]
MSKFSAVVFDLDGTLADTFQLIVACWNEALKEPLGRTFAPEDVIARFGEPEADMLAHEVSGPALSRAVDAFHECYDARHDEIQLFDGVPEMLAALKAAGVRMAVMTGKGRRSADITAGKLGWNDIFEHVITGDDVAGQKPAPDGPLLVAKLMEVEPARCVFVGDTPADITAGRDAGMQTIAAAWHPVYLDQLRGMNADYWADTPADVVRIVLG